MKSPSSPRLVLVDYDDTFVSTNVIFKRRCTQLFEAHGHSLPDELWNYLNERNVLPLDYLVDGLGARISLADKDEIERGVRAEMKSQGTVPGAEAFVARMRDLGAVVALWTNSPERWVDETAPDGSLRHFDFFVYEAAKPKRESVLEAMETVGCAPHEVLGVDNAAPGVHALLGAGARAVHFQVLNEPPVRIRGVSSVDDLTKVDISQLSATRNSFASSFGAGL